METDRASEILRALADGRDPVTGEQFPPNSPYQQADTVRALFVALEALENPGLSGRSETATERRRPIDPTMPKVGAAWTVEEEQQLRDAFAAHKPIAEIASAHGRTRGAINSRLMRLGLLEPSAADNPGLPRRRSEPPAPAPAPLHSPPAELSQDEKDALPF